MPRALRLLAAAVALALAVAAAWGALAAVAERRALGRQVMPLLDSVAGRAALAELRSEPDEVGFRARLARALVVEALQSTVGLDAAAVQRRRERDLARLELATNLATGVLGRRPANHEAMLALGAATYLDRSLRQDNRLFTEARAWELPLRRAIALAPSRLDPARFLARAYLEIWPVLPAWKRREVEALLARGMTDRDTFERLIEPWLAAAGDLDAALALVPPRPFAWELLRNLFANRHDSVAYTKAANGLDRVLASDLEARVQAATEVLASGRAVQARADLLAAIAAMPVDGRFAPLLGRALGNLPAGPLDAAALPTLGSWTQWLLTACRPGDCPVPAAALGRLARAAELESPADQATLSLLAGDLTGAELLERRLELPAHAGWQHYRRQKVRWLLAHDQAREAQATLAPLLAAGEGDLETWELRAAVAAAVGDLSAAAEARHVLASTAAEEWPEAWWGNEQVSRLELYTARPARGLRLALVTVPPGGTVIAASLDGSGLGTFAVLPGDASLSLAKPLAPGIHHLELRHLAGLPARFGPLRLELGAAGGAQNDH